ncbi:biotin--[acetyl-CoA-carboxylase] ligase [Rathayibacter tritici]|uniref:biotin--[biotin carboxyl-carrier protein] ligase n=1 Tax=Rathayibacter tritici TaxID=33888 RepID=A0A160KU28_9MICO|nr:biotin--[acetyl-CoA-carboxylase] ligase [Rathayibacter tritici]AND17069.1 biotin--[acetyl-CoA-carboxylase] ligase [Rathayibacter tritici]PPF31114.1 biotin--[acetyl-CoA-carboxylase] ligase [Rathayibacter tritici]PPF70741.1 biotin--[acetyl-CoA-carboxylase] ligase [Rathayibacter tritici]PPG08749.1 biotin--[acetyl-CoA-carboxylase] ligase [Rathayibacter tritici]PPI14949.1 biotin--[acetyl-CoA-carboxylase] ligase [Rathayibacter tritici]
MQLPLSAAVSPRILVLESAGSTNDELRERACAEPAAWPHLSVIATDDQRAGRGRLGRVWQAPAGRTLAASTLVDASALGGAATGWLPLVAGAALARALAPLVDGDVAVKWPNDVLIDGRKAAGILAERLPDGRVVVGTGVNLLLSEQELPVPTATSLALAGASRTSADAVLAAFLAEFSALLNPLLARGDAESSGAAAAVRASCTTLGTRVRLELPDGTQEEGTAAALDSDGSLVLEQGGVRRSFLAGDVTHLRS